jgi:pimeloyl-ACP methyl ester carboxylesterase
MPSLRDRVTAAGGRLELLDLPGSAERAPIVLLHEGLGSVGLWRELPGALAATTGRRTVAFSRFGHGRSELPPWPEDRLGFHHREALRLLPELWEALEVREPLLVGHSDGASIGLIHAAHHAVAGVVAIAPHVFVESVTLAGIRDTRSRYRRDRLRERLSRHHDHVDAVFAGWSEMWLDPAFAGWNLEDALGGVRAPMLLIQGANDPYGTLEQLERIQAAAPGPIKQLVTDGGHSPQVEQPVEIIRAISEFAAPLP